MSLLHTNILSYIKANNWINKYNQNNVMGFEKDSNSINVFIDPSYSDYEENIYRTVEKIARYENREYKDVLEDILYVDYDKIYLRIFDEISHSNNSLLTFESAIKKLLHLKRSLVYSASSVETPKRFYIGQHSKKVNDFLLDTFLGHTQRGSFIFPIYVKITPKLSNTLDAVPFNREANKKFEDATSLLSKTLITTTYDKLLEDDSINRGISANYLENIGHILEQTNEEKIEIFTKWAITRKEDNLNTNHYIFNKEDLGVMEESARILKESSERKEVTLICQVKTLASTTDNDKTITLRTESDKKMISFQINDPSPDIIETSTSAFKDDKYIECRGILENENNKKHLKNIDFFSLRETREDTLF